MQYWLPKYDTDAFVHVLLTLQDLYGIMGLIVQSDADPGHPPALQVHQS